MFEDEPSTLSVDERVSLDLRTCLQVALCIKIYFKYNYKL